MAEGNLLAVDGRVAQWQVDWPADKTSLNFSLWLFRHSHVWLLERKEIPIILYRIFCLFCLLFSLCHRQDSLDAPDALDALEDSLILGS